MAGLCGDGRWARGVPKAICGCCHKSRKLSQVNTEAYSLFVYIEKKYISVSLVHFSIQQLNFLGKKVKNLKLVRIFSGVPLTCVRTTKLNGHLLPLCVRANELAASFNYFQSRLLSLLLKAFYLVSFSCWELSGFYFCQFLVQLAQCRK